MRLALWSPESGPALEQERILKSSSNSSGTSPLLDRSIHAVIDRLTEIQRVDDYKPDKLKNREIDFTEVYDQISSVCREE